MPGYPTPPGTRIAYDLDGSFVFMTDPVTLKQVDVHVNAVKALNDEYSGGLHPPPWAYASPPTFRYITVIFPSPRELTAVMAIMTQSQGNSVAVHSCEFWVSPDSTNGIDGVWAQVLPNGVTLGGIGNAASQTPSINAVTGGAGGDGGYANVPAHFRDYDGATNPTGWRTVSGTLVRQVRAVQARQTANIIGLPHVNTVKLHLYGKEDTTASTRRLEFWKTGTNLRIDGSDLWWSDIPQASSAQKSFRLKNMSPTLTAETIDLSTQNAASSTTPNPATFYTFSLDGTTWSATLAIPNLSPGAISAEIFIRAVVPSNAVLSRWSPRIRAAVGSWT